MNFASSSFVTDGRFQVIETKLSRSERSLLYICFDVTNSRKVVIKEALPVPGEALPYRKIKREYNLLVRFRDASGYSHPNIIHAYELLQEKSPSGVSENCYLCLEYIEGGSLDKYLSDNGALSQEEAIQVGISQALFCKLGHNP
jgi:serine/threonine protein kinase